MKTKEQFCYVGFCFSFRAFNRQQSWSSNPTQSNSFRVIQKITQTDGDDEEDDQPTVEYSPKTAQNFPQSPTDQVRKLKMNESDRDMMNKFRQGNSAFRLF